MLYKHYTHAAIYIYRTLVNATTVVYHTRNKNNKKCEAYKLGTITNQKL